MVSGDVGTWFNVFTDNPQLSSGHEPFSPNWMVQIATYTIYTGENAGDRDAEYSILWLKAYGCHAITVPGPQSREAYKPFRNPRKFEGVLPLLWHDEDDSIYAVPQRSTSLAHVIPADAVVVRPPIHGLDVPEVTRFVAAMEDPALPLADFSWQSGGRGPHRRGGASRPGGRGAGDLRSGMGRVGQRAAGAVTRDGIGLITVHPAMRRAVRDRAELRWRRTAKNLLRAECARDVGRGSSRHPWQERASALRLCSVPAELTWACRFATPAV